jgi:hypothetical protein
MTEQNPGPAEERYRRDPRFAMMVHVMRDQIHAGNLTPAELQEAVLYAATLNEPHRKRVGLPALAAILSHSTRLSPAIYQSPPQHLNTLEETIDEVLVVWRDLVTRSPSGFSMDFWEGERDALGPWRQEIENAIKRLARWDVDRADLIAEVRQAWAGHERSANFDAVADELMSLAQNKLRQLLISKGFNSESAAKAATCFRLGANLTRPEPQVHIDSTPDTTGPLAET